MKVKGLNSKHFIKAASPHRVTLKEHSMVALMQSKFVNLNQRTRIKWP